LKNFFLIITLVLLNIIALNAQKVTGIVTDTNGVRLAGVDITLYSFVKNVSTTSYYDGTFTLDLLTQVENNTLPEGYNISNNYPNPFNPKTRINFTLPKASNIKAEIFNVAGQRVRDVIETNLSAGSNHLDLELNGLPNGFYFARIVIDGSYTVTKKLMLLYGSQHLNAAGNLANVKIGKTKKDIFIDSIVISAEFLERTRINPPGYTAGNTLDLRKIKVKKLPDPPYTPCSGIPQITYEGKTYNTVQIGSQCWLKENLDVGVMIKGTENQTNNNIIEKYCYDNDPANCAAYGGLYQWDEAMQYVKTEKARGICPNGWNLPTLMDFQTLNSFAEKNSNTLKSKGQGSGYGRGTNNSGFSTIFTGYWDKSILSFRGFADYTYFWSSNEENQNVAYDLFLNCTGYNVYILNSYKTNGFSVRCIKD